MASVLVTGAARRIGRALAFDFAAQGWNVAVHYNGSVDEANDVTREIRKAGVKAVAVQGDLARVEELPRIVDEASKALGGLSALINNASVFEPDEIFSVTPQGWAEHLDINLRAPVFLTKAFAAQLASDTTGNVINIADQRVWRLNPTFFSYTISKSALWTATRTLAQALAPRIRVNAIGPGPALASKRMDEETFQQQSKLTLLGRGTNPDEICAAIRFILSAPAMTGQMIALDGGQHLAWQTPDVLDVRE